MTPQHNMPTPAQIKAIQEAEDQNMYSDLGIARTQLMISAKELASWTNKVYTAGERLDLAKCIEDAQVILGQAQAIIIQNTLRQREKELRNYDK